MNLDGINKWLSLGANVGVLVGIIFLAMEIRQNSEVTIAAASEGVTSQSLEFFALGIDSQVMAQAIYKQSVGEELTGLEENQLWWRQYYNFRLFENAYSQYRRGFFDGEEWARYVEIIDWRLTVDPYARKMWADTSGRWTAAFEEEVNAIQESG